MARFSPPSCGVQVNKLWYKPVEQFILPEVRGVVEGIWCRVWACLCALRGRQLTLCCTRTALQRARWGHQLCALITEM